MPSFPGPSWLESYRDAINASETFREAAADWEGDVTLVVEAAPELGLVDEAWGWFDLHRGECREAKMVTPDEGERARYMVRGTYSTWKEVILGQLEPLRAMTEGKLRLSGDLPSLGEQRAAVRALVAVTGSVPTTFPDDDA